MDFVTPARITAITTALELGVDADDFRFASPAERLVWNDLAAQIDVYAEKDDLVWLSEAA